MWSALENIALRESLPRPLEAGESLRGVLVAGQIRQTRQHIHYLGHRRSRPYLLKQFYGLDTQAFLRWQGEARFMSMPQTAGYHWPLEEWRGGTISPLPPGMPLDAWIQAIRPPMDERIHSAAILARLLARLHASGVVHRNLIPENVLLHDREVTLTGFGASKALWWDDFWADTGLPPKQPDGHAYASPQRLRGLGNYLADEVFAFGALLQLMLTGRPAFGPAKAALRHVFPDFISPAPLSGASAIPESVAKLIASCMVRDAWDRPRMDEVCTALDASCISSDTMKPLQQPQPEEHVPGRHRIMVLATGEERPAELFNMVLSMAKARPSAFLFVGLIPGYLPSGHEQRQRARLIRNMSHGLLRVREAGLSWGLRMLDSVDPARAARQYVDMYAPDKVLIDPSGTEKDLRSRLDRLEPEVIRLP